MRPSALAIAAIGAMLCPPHLSAENLTRFEPDVVMECRATATGDKSSLCKWQCFTIPRPQNNQISTWPDIAWNFERLEFFSKPGRESENWLVVVKGRTHLSPPGPNEIFFVTVGQSFLCTYKGTEPNRPDSADVRLVKYY